MIHQKVRLWAKHSQNPTFTCRKATLDDVAGIVTVFEQVAPEIPVPIDTEAEQDLAITVIGECINTNESLVAVDIDGTIIGFRLARLLPHKGSGLFLEYVGVSKGARKRGIFTALMDEFKANNVTLNAAVLSGNQSDMINILVKSGFAKGQANDKETKLRWQP